MYFLVHVIVNKTSQIGESWSSCEWEHSVLIDRPLTSYPCPHCQGIKPKGARTKRLHGFWLAISAALDHLCLRRS